MGVEGPSFHGFVNDESLWNIFWCFLCIFYYRNSPISKTLGQFENLDFVIISTRENIRLIARAPYRCDIGRWFGLTINDAEISSQKIKTLFAFFTVQPICSFQSGLLERSTPNTWTLIVLLIPGIWVYRWSWVESASWLLVARCIYLGWRTYPILIPIVLG